MMKIAVIMTVHNRREKTLRCLDSLMSTLSGYKDRIRIKVFLTDDGSTDGTASEIRSFNWSFPIIILPGDGDLFWNSGMINSWKAAIEEGGWDGYLWLNDDTVVLPEFWEDLLTAEEYCLNSFGKRGIYAGSTKDAATGALTYGGFNYVNKWTLLDQFVEPDGESCQACEASHGNITYVSAEVVQKQGIFCDKYHHGGTDHDYTYLAHKAGFPILVLPHYSAICENDHNNGSTGPYSKFPEWRRANELLFARRCFPFRIPLVYITHFFKRHFPTLQQKLYLKFRGAL